MVSAALMCAAMWLLLGARALTIPDGIAIIGDGAFQGDSSITTVTIPESVTHIGANAFADCENLETIIIRGDSVTFGANALGKKGESRNIDAPYNSNAREIAAQYGFHFVNNAKALIEYARTWLGRPYVYGKSDCVMYMYYCFLNALDIEIEDTCRGVAGSAKGIKIDSIDDLEPGDVMCWKSEGASTTCTHVGMFVSVNSNNVITVLESSQSAGKVRYLTFDKDNTGGYYMRNYLHARRYF